MATIISLKEQADEGKPCSYDKCEVDEIEIMLKCSVATCGRYYHLTCAGLDEDKIKKLTRWCCSEKCTTFHDSYILRVKYDNNKKLLNKTSQSLLSLQQAFKVEQEKVEKYACELKEARKQASRIPQLEAEIANLKAKLQKAQKTQESSDAESEIEELLNNESDEEIKKNLTSIFKESRHAFQMSSSSPISRDRKPAAKKVSEMTEAEKLTHYQRLHVQRMEVPKLMKYSGDAAEWLSFKSSFERLRDKGEYDNDTMIEKLRESLTGEAERYVKQRLNQPFAVAENIMEVLKKKFFHPKEAVANALLKLESWKSIPEKCRKELEAFLFEVDNYIYLCETLKFLPELEVAINSRITNKLPYDVEMKWQSEITGKKIKGNIKELSSFLWDIVPNLPLRDSGTHKDEKRVKAMVNLARSDGDSSSKNESRSTKPKPTCWYCGQNKKHHLYRCNDFKAIDYEEKLKFLATNKICSRCLSSNQHAAINCNRASRIPPCKKSKCPNPTGHCSSMHPPDGQSSKQNDTAAINHISGIAKTMFKIVPVYVFDVNGGRVETTLLMDRAAGASLVNKEFFNKLGFEGKPFHLQLNWLQPNASHPDTNAIRHDLKIAPIHAPNRIITLHDMSALSGVVLPQQEQDPKQLKSEFPYLKNAKIPEFSRQRPQILLGLPHSRWMVSLETIFDDTQESAPIAERTPLGWTVSGSHWSSRSVFHVCESAVECVHTEISSKEEETLEQLHNTIKYFHSFEILGVDCDGRQHLSRDDALALQIMRHTMRRVNDRYEIGLYWKDPNCSLPDNYATALNRLKTTESRLKKLNMIEWANDHHKEMRELGFVREASNDDLNPKKPHKRINYVIGFLTFNLNKMPPKPRWVVDTASKHQGVSLNSQLLKGPDNLIPLTQALFHFRERAVATVGDVTKMYHQILIKKEDQQAQRFLWRNCDTSREPTIYIFQTMLFGPTCSPSQANAVRIDIATKLKNEYPNGSRVALNSMYMDDEFNSEDTPEEAAATANETIKMFKTISWDSVGFKSNSEATLKLLPRENVDNDLMLDLGSEDEILCRKVLGLIWNPKNDTFIFKVAKNVEMIALTLDDNYRPTKLEVLSFIMKIFDCLGLISHFIIRGRMILQSIWRVGIGWKQQVPEDIHNAWHKWIEKFAEIERLQIPRHYGYDSRRSRDVSLHIFVDASLEAYASIAFIRFKLNDEIKVCQIMAKCRVAPVRYTSVPKLELMAALMGARLAKTIKEQHTRLKFESTTFWSDSITVLRWLYSPSIRLQQFVAPRVSEIQDLTNVNDWRYISTHLNVADDGTKWNDIDFSSPTQRWIIGPKFLYDDEIDWPAKFPANVNLEEYRVMVASLKENEKNENLFYAGIIEGISSKVRASWKNYVMVVARVRRFIKNLVAKMKRNKSISEQNVSSEVENEIIKPNELRDAEHFIFKRIQDEVFREEKICLSKGRPIKPSSKLYSLNPFLDEFGLLRAKTRMALEETIPYDMRCPPILPNKHETVHAFLVHLHEQHFHIGVEGTAAEARSRAWIIHVRGAVQRVKSQCLYCMDQRVRKQIPPTAPLPSFRLTSTTNAFEHCGVDCCGPFTIYSGRSKHKRDVWVVVFTCMVTRAIYLRKIDSLSSDEMLLAIQDVWTRRGPIRHMHSDNGRNFIGAARIIKADHLQKLAKEKRLQWHFIPALTPQWGGTWERLIRDIKRAMNAELKKKVVGEKVFECILLQVEDIMNSRPLTHLPVSPDDLSPLTPNYLMKLHPGYSFVQSENKLDDEESRLYAKRARIISERLVQRWTKEYLTNIASTKHRKGTGSGLEINDFVVYMDPQVKPENWKRGIVIEVYRGRDGFARVADVKVNDNEILTRRSIVRLAKLNIDDKFFKNATCLLSKTVERDFLLRQNSKFFENAKGKQNFTTDAKYKKIIKFVREMSENAGMSINAIVRLWNELGQVEFYSREEVKEGKLGAASSIAELLSEERWSDKNNRRTVKINRVPTDTNFMQLLTIMAKLNWSIATLAVDSIAQANGCFVFVTFEKESMRTAAIELGNLTINGRDCVISVPGKYHDILSRRSTEYSFMCWNKDRLTDCCVVLARQKDSANLSKALPRFSGKQMEEYRQYMSDIDSAFINLVSKNPRPKFREERGVVEEEFTDSDVEPQPSSSRIRSVIVRVDNSKTQRSVKVVPPKEQPSTSQAAGTNYRN